MLVARHVPQSSIAAIASLLAACPPPAVADTTITTYYSILTALQDPTQFPNANPTFNANLSKPDGDPDLYINSISYTPGMNWDPRITLVTPTDQFYFSGSGGGGNSPYTLGTPIVGPAEWFVSGIVGINGTVDAAVTPGIYDFTLQVVGGADPAASDTIASIPLQYEVYPRLDVVATGAADSDPVHPGDATHVSVTLTNNSPDRALVVTTWYTYVPGFTGPDGTALDDYQFEGDWFGKTVAPGQSLTDQHTVWRTRPGMPGGTYTGRLGIYGGLHDGDYFEIAADPTLTLSGGPAIPGDANYSADIDPDDFILLDRGYANGLTGWTNGDFNGDGTIDQLDYLLLDESFAAEHGGTLSADFLADRRSRFGDGYVSELLAAVPEPSAAVALGALGAGIHCRRRRV